MIRRLLSEDAGKVASAVMRHIRVLSLLAKVCLVQLCPVVLSDTFAANSLELTAAERQWLAANHIVRVRLADYPPYLLDQKVPAGMSVDYLRAIADRVGFQVEFVSALIPWDEAMQDVRGEHRYYDLLPTMHRTPDRAGRFAFSRDYLSAPWVIISREDSPYYSGLAALRGKRIAVEKSFAIAQMISSDYPEIQLYQTRTAKDALISVATGQADAYAGNLAVASFLIRANRLHNLTVVAPIPFGLHSQAMAVRPDWPELASLIDKGLATMTSAERAAIDQQWGVIEFKRQIDYKLAWKIGLVVLLILIAFAYWNRRLAREIFLGKLQQKKIEYLAFNDPLTELPNRTYGLQRLQDLGGSHGFTVMFVDIRRLGDINRVHGHALGDTLLKQVGLRLKAGLDGVGEVCRMANDKFLLVFPELIEPADIFRLGRKFISLLSEPYELGNSCLTVNFALGAATNQGQSFTVENMLHYADSALAEAKRLGLNEFALYDSKMHSGINNRLQEIEDLKMALDRSEFVLYYQPKIDLARGALVGFEALIRWEKPGVGLVPPGQFISLAEDCGLIVPMSRWAIRKACRQIADWRAIGFGDIRIAVNLSAAHFWVGTLEEDVESALADSGITAELLELELTESLLMENETTAAKILERLKGRGTKISLDDFGTGYSSLSYLNSFDLDCLKIDQSFVRTLQPGGKEASMCEAIVVMAHKLGIKVVAEGVETAAQMAFLVSAGVDIGQGYLFSKPLSSVEIEELVAASPTQCMTETWVAPYQQILDHEIHSAENPSVDEILHWPAVLRSVRILIIDDTRFNIVLISKMLRAEGFEDIHFTDDSRQAATLFAALRPDLVILDLVMPELDGFEVISQIKAHELLGATPIVMMTAELNPEIRRKALQEGVRDFITKPFERAEVIARIRNVLSSSVIPNECH